jgi:preprotein translocase subunit SecD
MTEDVQRADMAAKLKAQLSSAAHKRRNSVAGRKAGERNVRAQHDGRVRRVPLDQAVQVNVLLRTSQKEWLVGVKHDHGLSFAEAVERGLELLRLELEGDKS